MDALAAGVVVPAVTLVLLAVVVPRSGRAGTAPVRHTPECRGGSDGCACLGGP